MKKQILVQLLVLVLGMVACQNKGEQKEQTEQVPEASKEELFVETIEQKHQKEKYEQQGMLQFDLALYFRGKARFIGKVSMTPDGGLVRMEDSAKVMLWNGKSAYISPDTASYSRTRFDVLTWSYFFAAPYKLSDPGTKLEFLGDKKLNEAFYDASKLTFEGSVGDSPDDWYIVYKDKDSDLLAALAYIVTYGKSKEAAEADPHAITYEAYTEINGLPIATQWNFWTWNETGDLNKLLGEASISKLKFLAKNEALFEIDGSFREAEKALP